MEIWQNNQKKKKKKEGVTGKALEMNVDPETYTFAPSGIPSNHQTGLFLF